MEKLSSLLLSGATHVVNQVLKLDPHTLENMGALEGKILSVTLTDLGLTLYLLPNARGVQLSSEAVEHPDAALRGTTFVLLQLLGGGSLGSGRISLEGDSHFVQTLQTIFKQVDIDWEEPLSRMIGDPLAHSLGKATRSAWQWGRQTAAVNQQNCREYLQEEYRLLPPREEMNDFFFDVNKLRMDTDRFAARLTQLMHRVS